MNKLTNYEKSRKNLQPWFFIFFHGFSMTHGGFLEKGYPYTNDDHAATWIHLAGHATYKTTQAGV